MALAPHTRAVVTGAGSGLGRAICVDLARRGARILAADIQLEAAEETVRMLPGTEAHAVRCDVADASAVESLAERAQKEFGGTDLVVNNAGVAVGGPVGGVSLEDWRWLIGVNLWGVIYGCHTFVPRFRAQRSGAVLNVASAAGLLSAPKMAPYNVSKAGVVALSETLHAELVGTGISVTVLCPTFFRTRIAENARGSDEGMRPMVEKLMARSKIQAPEVARFALDAVDAGRLYALPHGDGRWMWRMKRVSPEAFAKVARGVLRRSARG
jgi:NAD(P)-dependent dehydrogenase (short-subunit alcohol dehydrogenase family)